MKAILCAIVLMASFSIASANHLDDASTASPNYGSNTYGSGSGDYVYGSTSYRGSERFGSLRYDSASASGSGTLLSCGCEIMNEKFCNHDNWNGSGTCEDCGIDCLNDGLPPFGVVSCQQYCPGQGVDGGSGRYGSGDYGSGRYGSTDYGSGRYGSDNSGSGRYGSDNSGSGRDGSGSGSGSGGLIPCGCEIMNEKFCNHDNWNGSGRCEDCGIDCLNDGLPPWGVVSCQQYCPGQGSDGGSNRYGSGSDYGSGRYGSGSDYGSDRYGSGSDPARDCEEQEPRGPLESAINNSPNGCPEIMQFLMINNLPCSSDASVLHPTGIPRGVTTIWETCPCSCMSHPIDTTGQPSGSGSGTDGPGSTDGPSQGLCDVHDVVDLTNARPPQRFDTRNSVNNIDLSCGGRGREVVFKITVPARATLTIGQNDNDYDSRHELRVGGTCPGSQVIGCVDDPDTRAISYTNPFFESIEAFFIIDAYTDQSGTGSVVWSLDVPESSMPTKSPTMGTTDRPFPDSCDSYVCNDHYNSLLEDVMEQVGNLRSDINAANQRVDRIIVSNDELRGDIRSLTESLDAQQNQIDSLSGVSDAHSDGFQCMVDAITGEHGSGRYGSDMYGSGRYGSDSYGSDYNRGSGSNRMPERRNLGEAIEELRRKLKEMK